jgi:hypothetical protein
MLTLLFWNLNRRKRPEILGRLVRNHNVDILLLAENSTPSDELLENLNSNQPTRFIDNSINSLCERISIYSRLPSHQIAPIYETSQLTIRHLNWSATCDVLLAVTHLRSKLYQRDHSQIGIATEMARDIARQEQKIGHQRSLLIGDMNMNPFEHGMVLASGLHATMDRRIAMREGRKLDGKDFPFFYNPMWSLLGDASSGPPGTYYRSGSEHGDYFWHMFDQVLLRPGLLSLFNNDNLKVIDSDGEVSFLTKDGTPNKKIASDHLPILLRLNV